MAPKTLSGVSHSVSSSKGKEASYEYYYRHGVSRRSYIIIAFGWVLLTVVYFSILYFFRESETILGLKPAAEFCELSSDTPCNRTDLFAFQVAAGIGLTISAIIGLYSWHISRRAHTILPSTPQGRLFGYLPEAEDLAAISFCFQTWDFFISLIIPEHATYLMLGHHIMAATVSFCSIQYQYLHYYGIFFLGITEVSSIFLVYVHLAKYFPPVPDTLFDKWVAIVCGPMFFLSFLYYRVFVWWPESWRLFRDVKAVVSSGQAQKFRPGSTWVLYLFLALNLPLGLIQLYWTTIIFEEAHKVVSSVLTM